VHTFTNSKLVGFGGLVVSMLAVGHKVYGFRLGLGRSVFKDDDLNSCEPPE
jgi:hypothetical protein